ncbi:hypothetical protein [Sphingomonas sp. GB1N7]|uniref:hypothetical protein n=1 Tax=Parasphingomonas caseinilytica TaxID=3096158 RepID=UPI002FC9A83F
MARQIINLGSTPNDGTGDNLRAAFTKANGNFNEAYNRIPRTFDRYVASVALSGKMAVAPLTTTDLTPSAVDCSTTGVTFQMRVAAPAQFDSVRVIMPNSASTPVTGLKIGYALPSVSGAWKSGSIPSIGGNIPGTVNGNPNNDIVKLPGNTPWSGTSGAYGWRTFLWRNRAANEVDLPSAIDADSNNPVPSWTATDWTSCIPAARTDGGTLPLIDIRVQYPQSGYTPVSGAASSSPGVTRTSGSFGNWGIDGALEAGRGFNGGRMWRAWAHPALGVNSGINFQGSNQPQTVVKSIPIIVQFRCAQQVQTILYANDSISEFNSTGEYANSYAFRAALAAATATGKIVSWCPITVPSGSLSIYGRTAAAVLDFVRPSVLWMKPIGPNETVVQPLNATVQDNAAHNLSWCLELGRRYGSKVIIEPHLAVNNSGGYGWNASDSIRVAWNTAYQAQAASRDYIFADLDTPWTAGGSVSTGQQQPLPANTSDGVHSSDAGFIALTPNATTAASNALNLE